MTSSTFRVVATGLVLACLTACAQAPAPTAASGPAGVPSTSDVNPITGSRGGSGAH